MAREATLEDIIVERLRAGRIDRGVFELLWELAERNNRVVHIEMRRGSCKRLDSVTVCIDEKGVLKVLHVG